MKPVGGSNAIHKVQICRRIKPCVLAALARPRLSEDIVGCDMLNMLNIDKHESMP